MIQTSTSYVFRIYCHFAHISIYLSSFNCQCFNKHYIMLCRSVILHCHLFLFRMTMSGHVLMRDTLLQSTTLRIYSEQYPCMQIYAVYSYYVLYLYVCLLFTYGFCQGLSKAVHIQIIVPKPYWLLVWRSQTLGMQYSGLVCFAHSTCEGVTIYSHRANQIIVFNYLSLWYVT